MLDMRSHLCVQVALLGQDEPQLSFLVYPSRRARRPSPEWLPEGGGVCCEQEARSLGSGVRESFTGVSLLLLLTQAPQ
ncbi:hypothetical protein E2C01_002631 [Portunus trituberculatus]|uniref:Uncharacterized protein n=1 Tax=Portunus trituberculatus TaxID=210409 RepID=A0A5B7CNR6_PORTR|nr:hypothetical protein [Portunus trituberculatus]